MAKKTKSPSEMSIAEIDVRLAELAQETAELSETRAQLMITGRKDVAAQVKEMIQSAGYSIDEIVPLVQRTGRRGRRSQAVTPGQVVYPRFVDPDNPNNAYSRGVLPGWMKERMLAHGLDPSSKADRETFKTTHLRKETVA